MTGVENFFTVALSISLIFIIMIIIAYLVSYKTKTVVDKNSRLRFRSLVGESEPAAKLINYFVEAHENTAYNATALSISFCAEKFQQLLEAAYPEGTREFVTRFCTLDKTSCQTIIKITGKLGNPIFMSLNWSPIGLLDHEDRPTWAGKGFDLSEYSFENEYTAVAKFARREFSFADSVELVFPATLTYDHADVTDLVELLRKCEVERVVYDTRIARTRIFHLTQSMGHYDLVPHMRSIPKKSNAYLDLAYSQTSFEFQGEQHFLPMSSGVAFAIEALKRGQNLYILGSPGVGKTSLMECLQSELANSECNVIQITPGLFEELQAADGQSAFRNILSRFAQTSARNIICIDEAELLLAQDEGGIHSKSNTLLLQMLSGGMQKDMNCSCILTFNARPEQLNPALFRRGRVGVTMDLKPIGRAQANQLVSHLKSALPEKTFDLAQYENLLNEVNVMGGQLKYAEAGEITLADIYSCFLDRDQRALLLDLLRKAAGKQPMVDSIRPARPKTRGAKRFVRPDLADADASAPDSSNPVASTKQPPRTFQKPPVPTVAAIDVAKPIASSMSKNKKRRKKR